MEDMDRINQLAALLNRSSGDWLDAWNQATTSYATQADRDALAAMAAEKAMQAEELHDLLCSI